MLYFGQILNSYQVVGGGCELEDPADQRQPAVSGFAQQPHALCHRRSSSFALSLTNFITRVASGALVDCTSSSLVALGHMRRHMAGTQISDKVFRVVSFVAAHCAHASFAVVVSTSPALLLVRSAAGRGQRRVHYQAIPILHQHVPITSFASLPFVFLTGSRVSGRFMRFIRSVLAVEVHRRIARITPACRCCCVPTFGWKLFKLAEPAPSAPSTVKVSVRQQLLLAAPIDDRRGLFGDFSAQQAVAVC